MKQLSRRELTFEIEQLVLSYWREVDMRWGANAHAFFAKDGVFVSDNMRLEGADEIRAFYEWRRDRGARVARHLVSNLQVMLEGEDRAVASYVMTIFAGNGVPVLPVTLPSLISDVVEEFVSRDGAWLIEKKSFATLFKGEVPATVMPSAVLEQARASKAVRADRPS